MDGELTEGGLRDWLPVHQPLILALRRRITSLQTHIWCYSESGEYARHDPNVDVASLVREMRQKKLLPEDDEADDLDLTVQADGLSTL